MLQWLRLYNWIDFELTHHEEAALKRILSNPTAFIGGSVLVYATNSNDFDVFVMYDQDVWRELVSMEAERVEYDAGAYAECEEGGYIDGTYRIGRVNITVVLPKYWSAYYAASVDVYNNKDKHKTREERIKTYSRYRDAITDAGATNVFDC